MQKKFKVTETGESNNPLEFHLKKVTKSIHDLRLENVNMKKINLTLKKKIMDFEKREHIGLPGFGTYNLDPGSCDLGPGSWVP